MRVSELIGVLFIWALATVSLSMCGLYVYPVEAGERWRAQHANDPAGSCDNVCAWVRDLKMPDLPLTSCCGEADRFEADDFEREGDHYVAIITDGHGVVRNGTRVVIPNHKIKWDAGNPTGRGQVFLGGASLDSPGNVYCYVPPGGV